MCGAPSAGPRSSVDDAATDGPAPGRLAAMDGLSRYQRAGVGLWARGHAELTASAGGGWLALAAAHAVLARLRRWREPGALLAAYAASPAADLALAASVLPPPSADGLLWRVRDAAYHLRWREIAGEDACSTSGG